MTPVFQTAFYDEEKGTKGNCFEACLASILDMAMEQMPKISLAGEKWHGLFYRFMETLPQYDFEGYGDARVLLTYPGIDGYIICSGQSPRHAKITHGVIYKNGLMVHDPHPSGAGIISVKNLYLIKRS